MAKSKWVGVLVPVSYKGREEQWMAEQTDGANYRRVSVPFGGYSVEKQVTPKAAKEPARHIWEMTKDELKYLPLFAHKMGKTYADLGSGRRRRRTRPIRIWARERRLAKSWRSRLSRKAQPNTIGNGTCYPLYTRTN